MIKEVVHFFRHAPELIRLQRQLGKAQFFDLVSTRADAQGFADQRRALVADLPPRVLEVGCGTGAMFAYYENGVEIDAIEPDSDFLELAVTKAKTVAARVRPARGDAMQLAFSDASFDAVIFGMVLCSVPDVDQVLAEAHRVLRPGGDLRALEHVRSDGVVSGPMMDLVNPVWRLLNKQGCNMNRSPLPLLERAGFAVEALDRFQIFGELPAFPMQRIHARRR
ncbi:MAG TPA: class I SAM-dependent methyltransferase [Polyangiaceae bacterium]|nr:class I SAM-dependent methyltransferase [Polyangiaceae bacterium]